MIKSKGYVVNAAGKQLEPTNFERRDVGEHDILIEIAYCGICHSDLSQSNDEWGIAKFPMVPGHEIVGKVTQIGSAVSKFKVGDLAAVGCIVDSCSKCDNCRAGSEQFCDLGMIWTYNTKEYDSDDITRGGFANNIVVKENYVLQIPPNMDLSRTAPLLCAGITTYSPLKYWEVGPGQVVGIVGLGGLGHLAIKFAKAFGARVVLLTRSKQKAEKAHALGADEVIITTDEDQMQAHVNSFDFILNTISAKHSVDSYLNLLKLDGTMVFVGLPGESLNVHVFSLSFPRRKLAGSLIGGIEETQQMLDFCAQHNIYADIELISANKINEAFTRLAKSDVKYRFVIDMSTL